mmetsp:Transcript_12690/g.34652  ORF Transcript_12690/g.34652 Transcript_12690/m.34652 type:complete len:237 (+) Transcript_12690:550-1260(+)
MCWRGDRCRQCALAIRRWRRNPWKRQLRFWEPDCRQCCAHRWARSEWCPTSSSARCIPNRSPGTCFPDYSSALCIPNVTSIRESSHRRRVNTDPCRSRSSAIRLPVSSCQEHISRCWIKFECLDAKYTGPSSAGRLADVRWAIEFKTKHYSKERNIPHGPRNTSRISAHCLSNVQSCWKHIGAGSQTCIVAGCSSAVCFACVQRALRCITDGRVDDASQWVGRTSTSSENFFAHHH